MLKYKLFLIISFIFETVVELDSPVYQAFFIDNLHFLIEQWSNVKIYEIPAVTADSKVVEASLE